MKKRVLSVFLVLCFVTTLLPVGAFAEPGDKEYYEAERNNSPSTANIVYDDYTVNGELTTTDLDYFTFTLNRTTSPVILCVSKYPVYMGIKDKYGETYYSIATCEYNVDSGLYISTIYGDNEGLLPPDRYLLLIFNSSKDYVNNTYLLYFNLYDSQSSDHTHYYSETRIAPTCTEEGYSIYTCSCGDTFVGSYIAAYGHYYENGICIRCGVEDTYFIPEAPMPFITTSAGKPKIYWDAVNGAVKYWVYRSTDGVNFKYYDSTTKNTYTNNSTTIGTIYYYKVKAVNANGAASDYSVSKSILCKPAAPSVSINRSNGKPKLSWKAVSGATKYWIYRSTDGKEFKYFDSTTKTSYTNSGAASGTKYYYRVKAVAVVNGKNVASANSSTKSLFTSLAKPSVSITTSNGKPKITWKAVTGADKYYVYRSTDGKTFSYWDSTTKTSYVNSGAKKNTKYYYKVKAVCASNSNANSAQSTAVSIKATK